MRYCRRASASHERWLPCCWICDTSSRPHRVLVVVRNAIDVLMSTTMHRHFGKWDHLAHMYGHIVKHDIIEKQLKRIDRSFFQCMSYDSLPIIPEGLGEFLGLSLTTESSDWTMEGQAAMVYHNHSEATHDLQIMKASQMYGNTSHLYFKESLAELVELCGLPPLVPDEAQQRWFE